MKEIKHKRSSGSAKKRRMLLLGLSLFCITTQAAQAQDSNSFQTDWTMRVETEELKRQFTYKGVTVSPVAKVTVEVCLTKDQDHKKQYENVWFHDGKPLGLERFDTFKLDKGKSATIQVTHKAQGGKEEQKAAANMILRLVLDAYHNNDSVIAVKIPVQSFDAIVQEMEHLNCVETNPAGPDEASKAKLTFTLQANPDGPVKHLFFL